MDVFIPTLSYDVLALEPILSRDAVRDHLAAHRVCFEESMARLKGTELQPLPLESLVQLTPHLPGYAHLHRQLCRIRNHNFYWRSLQPGGGNAPWGPIADLIRYRYGTFARFVNQLQHRADILCGCGWLWIVWRAGGIDIVTTESTDTFPSHRGTVVLALDLWEHAYSRDFPGRRSDYVAACMDKLINWDFANNRVRNALLVTRRRRNASADRAEPATGSIVPAALPSGVCCDERGSSSTR